MDVLVNPHSWPSCEKSSEERRRNEKKREETRTQVEDLYLSYLANNFDYIFKSHFKKGETDISA